jgi:hypothetical protein
VLAPFIETATWTYYCKANFVEIFVTADELERATSVEIGQCSTARQTVLNSEE